MNKTNGWISLHRKITESPIWGKPAEWAKIWIYLLLEVNHQTGEEFFVWETIQRNCHVTRNQLSECLAFMVKEKMIVREKLPRGVKITVLNWTDYQNKMKPTSTPTSKPTSTPTSKPTSEIGKETNNNDEFRDSENLKADINLGNRADIKSDNTSNTHTTITTIINNNNNLKDYTYSAHEIFDYWNSKKIITHKSLEKIKRHITAALKIYALEEIKSAIDNYALVLSSPDKYYWTYKWDLKDFLIRGIERFLPQNFKEFDYFKRTYKSKAELEEERSLDILAKIYKEEEEKENDKKGNDNNIGNPKGSI
ncbi:MAG: hypothetical protein GYA51_03130 [Candidatus Methanofastidiosa archaeon]|nr:hypothetical protein [Candidatus Methanofastidiosa archaeon]